MKRIFFIVMCCLFAAGCATLGSGPLKNLTRIEQVQLGMSRDEIKGILGDQVVIGYEITDLKQGSTKPIVIPNPQRSETITQGTKTYEIIYYFTHIVRADGSITDDELTPLTLEDGRLVGKGWYFLNKIRKP